MKMKKQLSRGPTSAIVSALAERQPQSISDLSKETQIDIREVKARVRILSRQGYLRLTDFEE